MGSKYSNRSPPLSHPVPYSHAAGNSGGSCSIVTVKVGGANSLQRGSRFPIASAKRRTCPRNGMAPTASCASRHGGYDKTLFCCFFLKRIFTSNNCGGGADGLVQ